MHGPRITNEVRPSDRVPREELVRQHVALHPVAGRAGGNDVARHMRAAAGDGVDVVERRFDRVEVMTAVDAPPPAVTHRRALEGALGVTRASFGKGAAAVPITP